MIQISVTARGVHVHGGDTTRSIYMINYFRALNYSCSQNFSLFGLKFAFKYLIASFFEPRYLFIPIVCYLSMLRLTPEMVRANIVLSPKLCFLARSRHVKFIDWVDYLPLSYSVASKTKSLSIFLRLYYLIESILFLNAYKLFSSMVDDNIFVSKRDADLFERVIGNNASHHSHLKIQNFQINRPGTDWPRVLFIANFSSVFNKVALVDMLDKLPEIFPNGCQVILSGRLGDLFASSLAEKHSMKIDYSRYEDLKPGCADFGYALMPISAGQQNKIFDYLSLGVFPLVDESSARGIGLKVSGRPLFFSKPFDLNTYIERLFAQGILEIEINNYE